MTRKQLANTLAATTRARQLVDALTAVARVNHYMVGIVERVTLAEIQDAMQLLITEQNAMPQGRKAWRTHELALDLCEQMEREALRAEEAAP